MAWFIAIYGALAGLIWLDSQTTGEFDEDREFVMRQLDSPDLVVFGLLCLLHEAQHFLNW